MPPVEAEDSIASQIRSIETTLASLSATMELLYEAQHQTISHLWRVSSPVEVAQPGYDWHTIGVSPSEVSEVSPEHPAPSALDFESSLDTCPQSSCPRSSPASDSLRHTAEADVSGIPTLPNEQADVSGIPTQPGTDIASADLVARITEICDMYSNLRSQAFNAGFNA